MNDRFNATTGSSARRSEVHPGTEGHRIGGSHQGHLGIDLLARNS